MTIFQIVQGCRKKERDQPWNLSKGHGFKFNPVVDKNLSCICAKMPLPPNSHGLGWQVVSTLFMEIGAKKARFSYSEKWSKKSGSLFLF